MLISRRYFFILILLFLFFIPGILQAAPAAAPPSSVLNNLATDAEAAGNGSPSIITQTVALTLMALLPYFIVLLTGYIKIAVVLSILRNALGLQQSPPNQVINGLAIILSIYIMYPTGLAMYDASKSIINQSSNSELISTQTAGTIIDTVEAAKEPLRAFLVRNSVAQTQKSFYKLALKVMPPQAKETLTQNDFLIVIPTYIISQLKAAYEIGVLIYLPFFVIDIVTSNILLAMGMMMLSPLSISLPLKLLLLVMVDGWTVLIQGLVLTFK